MTIDEAIKHAEEVMIENLEKTKGRNASDPIAINCFECAEQHRQLAEWLKDYKRLLEQESCGDAISREDTMTALRANPSFICPGDQLNAIQIVEGMPSVTSEQKIGHCRDCKWWKDSDGFYRRGGHAESQCPINRREVFEGTGYCYMFDPQESETWNGIHGQITAPKGTFKKIFDDAESEDI